MLLKIPAACILTLLIFSFEAFSQTPSVPSLSSPPNGAANLPTEVTLVWGMAADATSYDFECVSSSDFTGATKGFSGSASAAGFAGSIPSVTYSVANNTKYYWHIRSYNSNAPGGAYSAWSSSWSFTVGSVAVLPSRLDNAAKASFAIVSKSICYSLLQAGHVEISLYTIAGKKALAINQMQSGGYHQTVLDGYNLPAGSYFVRFKANGILKSGMLVI